MKTKQPKEPQLSVARTLAAEDIRCGDFVSRLNETFEYPSFLWCADSQITTAHQPVRIRWQAKHAGVPLKVKSICLPFVLVKEPTSRHHVLDIRQCQLVRLDRSFAREVWKAQRKRKRKRNR